MKTVEFKDDYFEIVVEHGNGVYDVLENGAIVGWFTSLEEAREFIRNNLSDGRWRYKAAQSP